MNIALIQAGGVGTRINDDVPKQFLPINNKPLVIYTLERFQNSSGVDAIVVICLDGWQKSLRGFCAYYKITKLREIVIGGDTGIQSIINGLSFLAEHYPRDSLVMIHEAVRPMVSVRIIEDSIRVAKLYGNAVSAIPCVDEMLSSQDQLNTGELIPRDGLYSVQNPHTFKLEKLIWAYNSAIERGLTNSLGTAVLMHNLGEKLYLSLGSIKNFKVTVFDDIEIVKAIISGGE
ncbi:MAG: 2-C-methyl-D-erythritol 4-phosphate cytidylyltransferase [Clostridiales bacterium]|nr:2-C-methyl-D-erythritol 4-phosphate cytidylyltransferase [Clostridiales bacterium]